MVIRPDTRIADTTMMIRMVVTRRMASLDMRRGRMIKPVGRGRVCRGGRVRARLSGWRVLRTIMPRMSQITLCILYLSARSHSRVETPTAIARSHRGPDYHIVMNLHDPTIPGCEHLARLGLLLPS